MLIGSPAVEDSKAESIQVELPRALVETVRGDATGIECAPSLLRP